MTKRKVGHSDQRQKWYISTRRLGYWD